MSKPTQAVIDLSKKLWEKGARKEIEEGDWNLDGNMLSVRSRPDTIPIEHVEIMNLIPIWTSCDECKKWILSKGYAIASYYTKKGCLVILTDYGEEKRFKAPEEIEALLKAMLEVAK